MRKTETLQNEMQNTETENRKVRKGGILFSNKRNQYTLQWTLRQCENNFRSNQTYCVKGEIKS